MVELLTTAAKLPAGHGPGICKGPGRCSAAARGRAGQAGKERMNRRMLWALLIEAIGTVVFNVGWWMDWPPMVLFGVLLAVTGLDLWDEK